jgi:hypothetical protein
MKAASVGLRKPAAAIGGPVQKLLLSGGHLEAGAAGGGEGSVPLWRIVPRVGFIVTSLTASSRAVVRFYNKCGMAEQWIKEGKQAVEMSA